MENLGQPGEDCGEVKIWNNLIVYAYGGAGGFAGGGTDGNSGTGGGGYPRIWNRRRRSWSEVGGSHANGGGGYCGGAGETLCDRSDNGLGGVSSRWSGGGGYFSNGFHGYNGGVDNSNCIGGQGGHAPKGAYETYDPIDAGGDGGIAGRGGNVCVSKNAKVFAFNGNMYTDGTDYQLGNNQLEIFAQKGELRDVYKYNCWWGKIDDCNYEYFTNLFGDTVNPDILNVKRAASIEEIKSVLVRPSTNCELSGYKNNVTESIQGVGSRSRLYRTFKWNI